MQSEKLGGYQDVLAKVEDQWRRGVPDATVYGETQRRTNELTARAINPEALQEIEKEQAALDARRAELEAERDAKIQAAETYRRLREAHAKAQNRLHRADQQMAYELGNAQAQRDFILQHIGIQGDPFDRVGAFTPMFAQFATIHFMGIEWPKIREQLEAAVTTANNRVIEHEKEHGIGQAEKKARARN